ncbi:MAG: flippase [Actinomycetota bacterium]
MSPDTETPGEVQPDNDQIVTQQIRGSTLLLAGKVISVFVNLLVQVIIIRELTKGEYGAFAYALSLVTTASTVITLGIDRGITRFVAIYDEQGEFNKAFGTIALQLSTILSLGSLCVIAVLGLQSWITGSLIDDRQTVTVLVILVFLAPVQAIDGMMGGLFAVYAKPRAIFFRRNVLTPAMRLAVAGLLVASGGGPRMLAAGYVVTGIVGVATYTYLLIGIMRRRGILRHARPRSLSFPVKEVMAYTLPLLSSDVLFILLNTADAVLLGRYGGTEDVASYKVILPAAKMNQVVLLTFGVLFTPMAARLFARDDRDGIGRLYWETAAWVAVFSFPILALTTSLAPTITEVLFGSRYRSSWVYLALVSGGYYFSAALGFNSTTLKVLGRVRYIVGVSAVAALANLVLSLVLIPRHGPLGAAISTLTTLVIYNSLNQLGLRSDRGIGVFSFAHARVYVAIIGAISAVAVVQVMSDPALPVALLVAGLATLAVFATARSQLDIARTFPEVARMPLAGRLLVSARNQRDAGPPPPR